MGWPAHSHTCVPQVEEQVARGVGLLRGPVQEDREGGLLGLGVGDGDGGHWGCGGGTLQANPAHGKPPVTSSMCNVSTHICRAKSSKAPKTYAKAVCSDGKK